MELAVSQEVAVAVVGHTLQMTTTRQMSLRDVNNAAPEYQELIQFFVILYVTYDLYRSLSRTDL